MEGKALIPPDTRTLRLYGQYRELVMTKAVREHMGLTAAEWDEMPAAFTDWATEFWKRRRDG